MPVSIHIQVTHCINKILQLQPKSVLDVGCGFGKWGYLCREYLDVFPGRPYKEQWTTRIDAIEFFEPYIMEHQRFLYSNIMIGDVRDLCGGLDEYDVIIAGDVIEHMFKAEAEAVLETLYAKARQMLIVNIPLGEGWLHPEQYGNPAELHRSEWYVEDFQPFRADCAQFTLATGLQYGSFFCPKGIPDEERIAGYVFAADFYARRNEEETALRYARRALALDPANADAIYFLADVQLKAGAFDEAVCVLKKGLAADPALAMGHIYLAQILYSRGSREEARTQLNTLLALERADPACRNQAERLLAEWGGEMAAAQATRPTASRSL